MKILIKILCLSLVCFSCESSIESEPNVYGCTDEIACNYNSNANIETECEYPEENYDCNNNCTVETDCNGVCGGDAQEDYCGICAGTCEQGIIGSCDEMDCFGQCFGDASVDECGICNGDGTSCSEEEIFYLGSFTNSTLEILFSSTYNIAGFQFGVSGVDLISGSGGAAEDAGFTIVIGNILLGFAFDGSVIPPGEGVLTNLEITIQDDTAEICIVDLLVSDTNNQLPFQTGDCIPIP